MLKTNFNPFPTLITERLALRALEMSDDQDIFAHRSKDRVNTYLEDFRHASIQQTQAFIERVQNEIAIGKTVLWVISEKGRHKFLGTVCLWNISADEHKAETGYTLDPESHHKGYMNEALIKVIDFGFNHMGLKTIEAYTHEENRDSIRLLLKNNFKQGLPKKPVSSNRIFFSLSSETV
jgi:ribosomal-protein-alanine N-acetyltransferase